MDRTPIIGNKYKTNEGYEIEVIDYINKNNVLIKFVDRPELQIWSTTRNISQGQIKNPYHLSVYNRGYYGVGKYTARINNKKTSQYIKWHSMFVRCYDEKYQERQPQYIGCVVSDEFVCFQNFAQWYDNKIYECPYPLELDKDLLVRNNKIYSPQYCCFLPKEINTTINTQRDNKNRMMELYEKYKNAVPFI